MNRKERIISKALQSFSNFDLTTIQQIFLEQHLSCVYELGLNEGKKQNSHRKKVEQIRNGKVVQTYPSITDAARTLGVHKSTILRACKKGNVVKGSSTFRYKDFRG